MTPARTGVAKTCHSWPTICDLKMPVGHSFRRDFRTFQPRAVDHVPDVGGPLAAVRRRLQPYQIDFLVGHRFSASAAAHAAALATSAQTV